MTDIIGYINLFSAILQVGISLVVFTSLKESKVRVYYAISSLFLGLWSLSIFFYMNPIFFDTTTWLKIVYTMAYLMTLGLILFATVFPKDSGKKFRYFFWIIGIYMAIVSYILWSSDLIVISTVHDPLAHNSYARMGPLYIFYGLPEFITAIYVVGYYIKQVRVLSGIEKRQVQFYVLGGVLMLIPVLVLDFILPLAFDNTSFYKYSTIGNALWTGIIGYSIFTIRFLDMRFLVGTSISVALKALLITFFFFLELYFIQPLFEIDFSTRGFLKLFAFSILIAIVLIYLFKKIDQFLNQKVIYSRYDPTLTLRSFINSLSKSSDIKTIGANLLNLVYKSFSPSFASVILFDAQGKLIYKNEKGRIEKGYFNDISIILNSWEKLNSNRVLIYSELKLWKRAGKKIIDDKREQILSFMKTHSIEMIYSLREDNKLEGAFIVGQSPDKGAYSVGDVDFLDSLIQNAKMALVRAVLYLELNEFNESLAQQVDQQTKELQLKVAELEEARRKERDMIDIMGHELRTPATIAKLNIDFMKKFIPTNPEEYKKYLDRVKNSIESEIRLINALLTSAKLEGEKVEISRQRISVSEVIEHVIHSYTYEADSKSLRVIQDIDEDTPDVFADKDRFTEIVDNLLNNAIKYTNEGSIIIQTSHTRDHVQVNVIDTGIGIPEEELSMLGTKFHRVGNYINGSDDSNFEIVRPGGTGLGLYVVFALVEQMGGKIWVKSDAGKGTTFSFTLPVYTNQREEVIDSKTKNMYKRIGLKNS